MIVAVCRSTSRHTSRARRAERDADAELAPPLRDAVGDDAVEADAGQHRGQRPRACRAGAPASPSRGATRPTASSIDTTGVSGSAGFSAAAIPRACLRERHGPLARTMIVAPLEMRSRRRRLVEHVVRRRCDEAVVARRADDADDLEPLARARPGTRRRARPDPSVPNSRRASPSLTHDEPRLAAPGRRELGVGEHAPADERNAERVEIRRREHVVQHASSSGRRLRRRPPARPALGSWRLPKNGAAVGRRDAAARRRPAGAAAGIRPHSSSDAASL